MLQKMMLNKRKINLNQFQIKTKSKIRKNNYQKRIIKSSKIVNNKVNLIFNFYLFKLKFFYF